MDKKLRHSSSRGNHMLQSIDTAEDIIHPSHRARINRVHKLSHLLDEAFRIPGTKYRIGFDSIIGLIPGVGDTLGMLLSAYIVVEAARLGVPKKTLVRMLSNIALDTLVGAVPVFGDVFDVAWKANKKNVALLNTHLKSRLVKPPLHG